MARPGASHRRAQRRIGPRDKPAFWTTLRGHPPRDCREPRASGRPLSARRRLLRTTRLDIRASMCSARRCRRSGRRAPRRGCGSRGPARSQSRSGILAFAWSVVTCPNTRSQGFSPIPRSRCSHTRRPRRPAWAAWLRVTGSRSWPAASGACRTWFLTRATWRSPATANLWPQPLCATSTTAREVRQRVLANVAGPRSWDAVAHRAIELYEQVLSRR